MGLVTGQASVLRESWKGFREAPRWFSSLLLSAPSMESHNKPPCLEKLRVNTTDTSVYLLKQGHKAIPDMYFI